MSDTKVISVNDIGRASTYELLTFLENELISAVEQLAGTGSESERQLLVLYQKHLALTKDFVELLEKTGKYLRDKDASKKEMEEFLDIEEKARAHSLALIDWMEMSSQLN